MRWRRSIESESILSILPDRIRYGGSTIPDRSERGERVNRRQCHRARCRQLEQCGRQGIVRGQRAQLRHRLPTVGNDEGTPLPHALKVGPEPSLEFARSDRVSSHVVIVTTLRARVNRFDGRLSGAASTRGSATGLRQFGETRIRLLLNRKH